MADDMEKTTSAAELRRKAEEKVRLQHASANELDAVRLLHELQVHQIELEMQNEELHLTLSEKSMHETHLLDIIKHTPAGYFHIDLEGRFLDVNDAWLRMHGYDSKDEVVGRHFSIMQVDSGSDSALVHLAELQKGMPIPYGEFSSRRKDGSVGHHTFSALPVVNTNEIVGFEWFIIDSSASYQMAQVQSYLLQITSLRPDGDFFELLASYLADTLKMDFVCIDRLEGDGLTARTVAVWSDGHFEDNVTYALKDTPCGDVVGKRVCCFPASVCQLFPNDQVLQDLKAESYVGVTLWSHTHEPIGLIAVISRRPLPDRQLVENVMNLVGICAAGEMGRLDAAALLHKSEAKYRQLFHNQPTAYALHEIIMDAEGKPCDYRFLEINPAFEEYTGLKAADIIGKTESEILPNSEPFWVETYGRVALTGEAINFENFSGELNKYYQVSAYSPEPGKFATAFVDITDRIRSVEEKQLLEQQLQHTQKLESLGVLSGGIAHDFNNILAIIVGYCSLTKMDYETAEQNIPHIEKAAERAAALCRQMLAYAGKAQLTMSQINMRNLVDEMVTMLKATLPQNAEIYPDLSTDVPSINGDSSQIRQIIMNLIINASEAIGKEHGEIRVSLATTDIKTGQSEQDYNGKTIPPGKYVYLEVTDNGCGMDEETKWRIFEPFYTTKFTGRGLGMSAVLGIIKSHGGALQLHSEVGQGTTFKVYLPVQKNSASDENTNASVLSTPWQGSGTILLVEDEDQVRLIAKALLKKMGFTVLEAANGKEALELYQKNATDITLVMTDIGMPIMDGYELFQELKNMNPELPIIVSSGYGDAEVSSRIDIYSIAGIISKPYGPDQLREVLKRALEGIP